MTAFLSGEGPNVLVLQVREFIARIGKAMCRCYEKFLIGFLAFPWASLDIGEVSDIRIDRMTLKGFVSSTLSRRWQRVLFSRSS